MAKKVLLLCLAFAALAGVAAQFNRGANEYTIESAQSKPIKSDVVFKTGNPDEERRSKLPQANLVIGIMSAPGNFEQRSAARSSWVQLQSLTDPHLNDLTTEEKQKLVIRFVIGTPKDASLEPLIAKESATYHDIIRVPVVEDYFQLTLKTLEFFKWADSTYQMQWVFKCDDDSFVRVDKLLRDLQHRTSSSLYMGKMWTGTPVDRRIDSFTPFSQYNTFAAGAGYAVSWDLISYIVRHASELHMYPAEDVAVGMWLAPLKMEVVDHPHFHSYQEGCDKDMIVQNPAPPKVMREVFYHTVNGVPCHMKPDPFDPANKNITDHVLLQFGIPKPQPGARHTKSIDPMSALGAQTLVDISLDADNTENSNNAMQVEPAADMMMMNNNAANAMNGMMNGNTEKTQQPSTQVEEEEVMEEMAPSATGEGMTQDVMNGNTPSSTAISDMNKMGHGAKGAGAAEETAAAEKRMNDMTNEPMVVM